MGTVVKRRHRVLSFSERGDEHHVVPIAPRASLGDSEEVTFLRELDHEPAIGVLVRVDMAAHVPYPFHVVDEVLGHDGDDGEEDADRDEALTGNSASEARVDDDGAL